MPDRKSFFASAAALGVFAALTGAHAQPASVGRIQQLNNTAFIRVDYAYPDYYGDRYYGYRREYYGDGLFRFFEIPGAVTGGLADLLSGAPGYTYYDSSYNPRPLYVSPYYGRPYRNAYYGGAYYNDLNNGGASYLGLRYGGRGYYDDHRNYDDRRQFTGRRYDGDRGYYPDRYYDNAYYARGYYGNPSFGDAYDRGRSSYNNDDDDD